MPTKPLTFVTGNANKLREVKEILSSGGEPIEIISQELDVPELQGTTQEVAREKCRRAAAMLGGPCITEDTALCFQALNGLPGVYIKHFMVAVGHDGLNNMLKGFIDPSTGPDSEPILFEGRTDGHIVPARGEKKFGWDPTFQPIEGGGKTYAEMTAESKNLISHRYRALDKLRAFLRTLEN